MKSSTIPFEEIKKCLPKYAHNVNEFRGPGEGALSWDKLVEDHSSKFLASGTPKSNIFKCKFQLIFARSSFLRFWSWWSGSRSLVPTPWSKDGSWWVWPRSSMTNPKSGFSFWWSFWWSFRWSFWKPKSSILKEGSYPGCSRWSMTTPESWFCFWSSMLEFLYSSSFE